MDYLRKSTTAKNRKKTSKQVRSTVGFRNDIKTIERPRLKRFLHIKNSRRPVQKYFNGNLQDDKEEEHVSVRNAKTQKQEEEVS